MLKKLLAVCAATLLTLGSYVAAVELRADHPDTYVVQKGDTLWDIAARFLNEPWLWPEIWQANPQIENPHLIYPGDVLSLAYVGGRPTLVKKSPQIRRSSEEAINTVPLSDIEAFLYKAHVLDEDAYRNLPYVVGLEESRLMSTEGQVAYLRRGDFAPGQRWAVVRPTLRYMMRTSPEREPRVRRDHWDAARGATPNGLDLEWAFYDLSDDGTEVLGYEVVEVAQGTVTRSGDPATLLITPGGREVKKGDLLLPLDEEPFDLTFHPRAIASMPPDLLVLAVTDRGSYGGPRDVIAISGGSTDGIENGHVFSIYRPGDLVRDEIAHQPRIVANLRGNKVALPDEFVGHAMVFRTFDRVSYALIMDGIRPARLDDRLRAPERP